ncbi:superoxide dismutase family protein [Weeksellaceae bacterium KMM 9724]|uniref:superoxide dismutase family protein n=1 Tax=Profundicola chukchiensis TaxID=2961959 RepID=UPI0024400467|nr:superoxide dismutase family protein [Profundicola chukchiensis]MDG4950821.1 superoxide dismutase family protein [Profundicola chukchiensis]
MNKLHVFLGMGLLLLNIACDNKNETVIVQSNEDSIAVMEDDLNATQDLETEKVLKYDFSSASDSNLSGTATFTQVNNEVTLEVNLEGITPGEHAIHVHEKGDCSAPDATSAGGHWNPTGAEHGKFDMDPFHMGDIGNLTADADGKASLTFTTDKWCLDCEDETKNLMGKSLIVHESVDDFTTQPTGDAGGRIGCLVIE